MLDPLFPAAISSQTLTLLNAAGRSVQTSHSYSSSPSVAPAQGARPPPPEPEHATGFNSIQGRYNDLEKGPKADKELKVRGDIAHPSNDATLLTTDSSSVAQFGADPDAPLFQQTFEVEWVEDSPGFRHRLTAVDENVEGLRQHMLRLVSICRQYCQAGTQFCEIGREFASEMMNLQGEVRSAPLSTNP